MTSQKHLKARIRARMAKTGESYLTARRYVVGSAGPAQQAQTDHGWKLRGGGHPDAADIVNVLAHLRGDGPTPALSEPMVLGIGGGLGAGYILWEFAVHDAAVLTLGFRNRWNYIDWVERTLGRLGAGYRVHTTGGEKGASAALRGALDAGKPAIIWADRQLVGYWHLPAHLEGRGGHPVVAYAATDDGVRLDDRNLAPLTVERAVLDRARARVPSYKNRMVVVDAAAEPADLAGAVRAGIADCVAYLGGDSASFALPAWRKWARMFTDTRNAKGWPQVFADGSGLVTALLSIWEGVEPVGMDGGHLRDVYADFLDEAAPLLPDAPDKTLAGAAEAFRVAGARWHELAETALPADVPEYARLRELTAEISAGVVAGDAGEAARSAAAEELWRLRADYDHSPPVAPDLPALAARMSAIHEAERDAVAALARAVGWRQ